MVQNYNFDYVTWYRDGEKIAPLRSTIDWRRMSSSYTLYLPTGYGPTNFIMEIPTDIEPLVSDDRCTKIYRLKRCGITNLGGRLWSIIG
jgi:hypothetical protein